MDMKIFWRKHGNTICTIGACAGVAATTALTFVGTRKATTKLERLKVQNRIIGRVDSTEITDDGLRAECTLFDENKPIGFLEELKYTWKYYIPAAISMLGTMACIISSHVSNKKLMACLSSTYFALDNYANKLKSELKTHGIKDIPTLRYDAPDSLSAEDDGTHLFYYSYVCDDAGNLSGQYFETTVRDLYLAMQNINRTLNEDTFITLNTILQWFNLDLEKDGDYLGYDAATGINFIDFETMKTVMDDGLECWMVIANVDVSSDIRE